MPGEGEKEKGGEWDRTHSSGPMFEASHAPSSTRSGADSASPGQANGADVMRLKARAEILARKIENTSRQMAKACVPGRVPRPKQPRRLSLDMCVNVLPCTGIPHGRPRAFDARASCSAMPELVCVSVRARVSAAAQPSLTTCLCWTHAANAVPGVVIK
jgi:hypothetical protein